ncbi:MAG: flagellar basal body rod protein FlgB [Ruminiclostridium sp.]|jgi:flagellar basal-body rod protein FlgB|nr:flagellar basal body rod protein FlgB [Ruminiclostridium sp.]MCI9467073.1 flagellar basal body rod protein FlgB [Ruminiclostridium sp.]
MDFLRSNSMVMMERSMDFLWTKQAAIMDNIANAETPNYKAKVVTFEQNLTEKLQQAATVGKRSRENVRQVLENADFAVYDIDEAKRMDDNGVDATEQMVEMVRNAYQQQYLYNAINKSYSILRMAVRGQ